jgi:TolA-binding protein
MNQEQITDLIGRINRSNGNGFSYCELRALEDTINQLLFVREKTREAYARQKDRLNKSEARVEELTGLVAELKMRRHEQEVVIQDLKARQWRVEVPCSNRMTATEVNRRIDEQEKIIRDLRDKGLEQDNKKLRARVHELESISAHYSARLLTLGNKEAEAQVLQTKLKVLSDDLEDLRSRNQTQMITISKFQEDTARFRGDLAEIRRITDAALE